MTATPPPHEAERLTASPLRRWPGVLASLALAGLLVLLALGLGWMGGELLVAGFVLTGAPMVLAALWLAGAALVMLAGARDSLRLPDPLLDIGPDGVLDQRLSPRRIAWADLDWDLVRVTTRHATHEHVLLRLRAPYPLNRAARGLSLLARVLPVAGLRNRPLHIQPVAPRATTARIAEAMARHRPPAGSDLR